MDGISERRPDFFVNGNLGYAYELLRNGSSWLVGWLVGWLVIVILGEPRTGSSPAMPNLSPCLEALYIMQSRFESQSRAAGAGPNLMVPLKFQFRFLVEGWRIDRSIDPCRSSPRKLFVHLNPRFSREDHKIRSDQIIRKAPRSRSAHVLPGILRIRMFATQDPGLSSEDVLEICVGFLKTAELRTGDGIHPHCYQSPRIFQAVVCFGEGNELGGRIASLLIPIKVK